MTTRPFSITKKGVPVSTDSRHAAAAARLSADNAPARSGSVTANRVDFIAFPPQGGSAPKTLSPNKVRRWTPEAREAIEALPDSPIKEEMQKALGSGQVRGGIFAWPKQN